MSTKAYYHPRELSVDLADLPVWLYNEIASLHGQIAPPPSPPVLSCLGNGDPMYIYRKGRRYFARHYPGGNSDGHSHFIATMSDEHRRQAEYSRRAAELGGLTAQLERSTGNGTRLDVAVSGHCNIGLEVQRSALSRAKAKSRAAKSFQAGWPTAWVTDSEKEPDWADHVPTARLTTRGGWDESLPPPNTARVIISDFERERDRKSKSGWRYVRVPKTILLDELSVLMPAGEILPLAVGSKGGVALSFRQARDVIDSCTYPGASTWTPQVATPRHKETSQFFSTDCSRHSDMESDMGAIRAGDCTHCGAPLWAPQSIRRGFCEKCRIRGEA